VPKENGSNKSLLSMIAVILALSTACTVFLQIYLANQQTTKLRQLFLASFNSYFLSDLLGF